MFTTRKLIQLYDSSPGKQQRTSLKPELFFLNWQVHEAMELSRVKMSRTRYKRLCVCRSSSPWTFMPMGNNLHVQKKQKTEKWKLLQNTVQNMDSRFSGDFRVIIKRCAHSVSMALFCHGKSTFYNIKEIRDLYFPSQMSHGWDRD